MSTSTKKQKKVVAIAKVLDDPAHEAPAKADPAKAVCTGDNGETTAAATQAKQPRPAKIVCKNPVKGSGILCTYCCESINEIMEDSTRLGVACPKCALVACLDCHCRVLLDPESFSDFSCKGCKAQFSRDFLVESFGPLWVNQVLAKRRGEIVFDRVRGSLPQLQAEYSDFAKKKVRYDNIKDRVRLMEDTLEIFKRSIADFSALSWTIHRPLADFQDACKTGADIANIRLPDDDFIDKVDKATGKAIIEMRNSNWTAKVETEELMRERNERYRFAGFVRGGTAAGDPDTVEPKQKEYLTRGSCPKVGCRGFVNDGWECGICNTKVCSHCMMESTVDHTCKAEDIESVNLIRQSTKPCPSCRARVTRVSGCAQMWCTSCHTAFDYNTLKVYNNQQNIHNPHFIEFMRNRPNAIEPRVGRGGCGQFGGGAGANFQIQTWRANFSRFLSAVVFEWSKFPTNEQKTFANIAAALERYDVSEILRLSGHVLDLPGMRGNMQKVLVSRADAWDYLCSKISEEDFRAKLQMREKHNAKQLEIAGIRRSWAEINFGLEAAITSAIQIRISQSFNLFLRRGSRFVQGGSNTAANTETPLNLSQSLSFTYIRNCFRFVHLMLENTTLALAQMDRIGHAYNTPPPTLCNDQASEKILRGSENFTGFYAVRVALRDVKEVCESEMENYENI